MPETTGHYIFFHEPPEAAAEDEVAGWCVAVYLGDATGTFRKGRLWLKNS